MVAWTDGYFVYPFKGQHGVTKGNPLSLMIFNGVIDVVLWYWIALVAEAEEETVPEFFAQDVKCLATYLYVNDFLLVSTLI